jgi:hypothetical protein
MELHPDDETWVGDDDMYRSIRPSNYETCDSKRQWVQNLTKRIREDQDTLVLYRSSVSLLERMNDIKYKHAVHDRLVWEFRDEVRYAFLYVQNAQRFARADAITILSNSTSRHGTMHVAGPRSKHGHHVGRFINKYLLWMIDAVVWVRPRVIACRVVQCLV